MRFCAGLMICGALLSSRAAGQSTSGTISGRATDPQHFALPGVTVTATSASLQGQLTAVTSDNGDYLLTLLPSGTYTIRFELNGFQSKQQSLSLAPTEVRTLNVLMGPAAVSETVEVIGHAADLLTETAQVATNFQQDLIASLPTNRDINASVLMAPAVHATGPNAGYSIAGSMSFENLFLVNGVTINENVRGQPTPLFIEDAIQETTVASAGISAEYGRFGGGVVNVVTKSGGNLFSGSFRDTLVNDDWRALTPFAGDTKLDKVVPTYEYTFGGPAVKDRLWFFTAGRLQNQSQARQTVQTLIPYTYERNSQRYEGKVTYALASNHRFQGAFTRINEEEVNTTANPATSMDLRSNYTRELPQDLLTINYSGALSPQLFVEGRYSMRNLSTIGTGSTSTDLIDGTLVLDRGRNNLRYWSPTFCGVCDAEERDNANVFVKATYFLSTADAGSHNLVFGYDTFDDRRFANNHQSGSDYRILGTTSIIVGTDIYPRWLNDGSTIIEWNPIELGSEGTHFRTHSLFFNDNWRMKGGLTFNLGLRFDKNHGVDAEGQLVAKDSIFSPRLGVVWDPGGEGRWSVNGSFSRYVAALNNFVGDSSSAGGNPAQMQWAYRGPAINTVASGALVTTDVALQTAFDWFFANNIAGTQPSASSVPGVSVQIPDGLTSPNVIEWAGGVSRHIGERLVVRADLNHRDYRDFYSLRIDTTTGTVTDRFGNRSDLGVVENTNDMKRHYAGMTASATYRAGTRVDLGGNYTLSRLWGNFDGENAGTGPLPVDLFQYPEYREASWYAPEGDLSADQRHRARIWMTLGVPGVDGLMFGVLQDIGTGVPYGAAPVTAPNPPGVNAIPYVTNPGYATPQGGTSQAYYFTARDALRTEGTFRTDASVNYTYSLPAGSRKVDFFAQLQVINVFNQFQLCGCGGDVFQNGGGTFLSRIDQTVLTNVNRGAVYQAFNPFTTTPIEGVHWDKGPNFGNALTRLAYTSPRAVRVTFGVRF